MRRASSHVKILLLVLVLFLPDQERLLMPRGC
uniref:Uncharacterized protein n=1 Tax=Rhizophora mucronata TaxID=61149 RepID=A0A2P2IYV5_RHIMU